MKSLPDEPFFIPRFKLETGGVNFLGMRQTNLDLREKCLPGFSNSTVQLRPFSVMCWVYWKLNQLAEASGRDSITNSQARGFREKSEVLFTWGHKLKGFEGLPGISFGPPLERHGKVSLTFQDWHRIPSSTGLMAAVNYGPALKTTIGLGFLNPIESEVFQPIGPGVKLARALDEQLQQCGLPSVLDGLDINAGTAEDALEAFNGWNVAEPSPKEQAAFRTAFYDPSRIDSTVSIGLRSATVSLILHVLEHAGIAMTVEEIRRGMFWGGAALPSLTLSPAENAARHRWIVFQVRQAQRIAMEALLAWVEKRIIRNGDRDTEALAVAAEGICGADSSLIEGGIARCVDQLLGHSFQGVEGAVQDGVANANVSIFHQMDRLQGCIRGEADEMVPAALRLLSLCREYAVVLEEVAELRSSLRHGGAESLSLWTWLQTSERSAHLSMKEFLLLIFEDLVLSQHLAVATRRYDGGVVRLRVTIEEDGLRALVVKPWKPAPAADKLASGLALMADCGLVVRATADRFAAAAPPRF